MEPTTKLFLISTQFSLQIQTETKRHMKIIGTHFLTNKNMTKMNKIIAGQKPIILRIITGTRYSTVRNQHKIIWI